MSNKLFLIIPTYMEAENIVASARELKRVLHDHDYEVLVIDDNSADGTWRRAREEGFNVLVRPRKMGLASAFIEGVKHVKGELIGLMDADLQHPPELLPSMIDEAYDADLVVGSRYIDGGGVEGWPFHRRVVSKCGVALAHLFLPKTRAVKDPMSGFFLVRRGVINGVELRYSGFKVLLEILVKGNYGRVVEVPYTFRARKYGKSKLDLKGTFKFVKNVFRLRLER